VLADEVCVIVHVGLPPLLKCELVSCA